MAAGLLDYFKKVGASTVTTLSAPGKALAANSITVGSTTNYPTDTGIVIAIRQVDANGNLIPGTYTEWNAIVTSATTLTIGTVPVLGTDQVYPAASTTQVYIPLSSPAYNGMIAGMLIDHNQDGTHKAFTESSIVPTAAIQDNAVTTTKIAGSNITAPKLATDAITIAYAQITGNVSTNASTAAQATGLSITPTIPSGGRRIEVSVYIPYVQLSAGGYADVTLWDGTVGSGTQLQRWYTKLNDLTFTQGVKIDFSHVPAAGSKTYNVGFTTGSGTTITINASTTSPASIHAKVV